MDVSGPTKKSASLFFEKNVCVCVCVLSVSPSRWKIMCGNWGNTHCVGSNGFYCFDLFGIRLTPYGVMIVSQTKTTTQYDSEYYDRRRRSFVW